MTQDICVAGVGCKHRWGSCMGHFQHWNNMVSKDYFEYLSILNTWPEANFFPGWNSPDIATSPANALCWVRDQALCLSLASCTFTTSLQTSPRVLSLARIHFDYSRSRPSHETRRVSWFYGNPLSFDVTAVTTSVAIFFRLRTAEWPFGNPVVRIQLLRFYI